MSRNLTHAMEPDKTVLIDSGSDTDVQFDVENQSAGFKNLTLVDQSKQPDRGGLADQNLDQWFRRQQGLIVTQNKPSWRSIDFPIILSCFTVVFCGVFFGLAAFILAYFGRSYAASGDHAKSRRMTRASYALSVAGVVIGIILIIVLATKLSQHDDHSYLNYVTSNYECYNPIDTRECAYGSKYDTSGRCARCCEMEESCCPSMGDGDCTYGWMRGSDGCRTGCCDYFNNDTCNTYGYYISRDKFNYDYYGYRRNGGCKQCCSPYDVNSCSLYGFYNDSNGCKTCCPTFDDQMCEYGWRNDSDGCKICCSSYEAYQCTQAPMNTTVYASNGCGGRYKIKDCETNGFYNYSGSYGVQCKRCCQSIGNGTCTYGWTKDSYGCRTGCCSPYTNERCVSYGSYYSAYDGCKQCCPSFNIHDCMRFGSYKWGYWPGSANCTTCCSPFRSSECQYGWKYDSNQCRRCCDYSEEYRCSRESVIIPVYNDTSNAPAGDTTMSGIY